MKLYAVRKRIRCPRPQNKAVHKHYDFVVCQWYYAFDETSTTSSIYEAKEVLKDNPDAEMYTLTLKLL